MACLSLLETSQIEVFNKKHAYLEEGYCHETFTFDLLETSSTSDQDPPFFLQSALVKASFVGDADMIILCVKGGALVNHTNAAGRSALHSAAAGNAPSIVPLLLSYLPESFDPLDFVNQKDNKFWTPLHIAVCRSHVEVAEQLLIAGADITCELSHSLPPCRLSPALSQPIHFAAMHPLLEMVQLLCKYGARLSERDSSQRLPLHYASCVKSQPVLMLEYLIEYDPSHVNATDEFKRTPLHCAASYGCFETCKLLMKHGADPTLKDIWDLTPRMCAKLNHHLTVADLLEAEGEASDDMASLEKTVLSLLATTLKERNTDQLRRAVKRLGPELCLELLEKTSQIESQGGLLVADGSRRRTAGGTYFHLMKQLVTTSPPRVTPDDWVYITFSTREQEKVQKRHRSTTIQGRTRTALRAV